MTHPLFSVIIPWHGNRDHLARAMASLAAQHCTDFETLIVCNGPAAPLAETLLADPAFAACRVLTIAAADASRARNAGIAAARGRYLAFLDVDDQFLPEKLSVMAQALASGSHEILLSRGYRRRNEAIAALYPPQLLGPDETLPHFFFARGANCSASAIVIAADLARRVRFADDLKKFEDNDFLLRAVAAGGRIAMLAEPLYVWHDELAQGRMSRHADYAAQRRWAQGIRSLLGEAGYHAFIARRIAQLQVRQRPILSLVEIWRGHRRGGIGLSETVQFVLRGLLPKAVVGRLIDLKARRQGAKAARTLVANQR